MAGFGGFWGEGVRGILVVDFSDFWRVFYKNYQSIQEFLDDDVCLLSKNIKCF